MNNRVERAERGVVVWKPQTLLVDDVRAARGIVGTKPQATPLLETMDAIQQATATDLIIAIAISFNANWISFYFLLLVVCVWRL